MSENDIKTVVRNRRAFHDYHILERLEAGIVLQGTEVKSIRTGKISLKDSYITIRNEEAFLINCHISSYSFSNQYDNHDPERARKLLLRKQEIRKLKRKTDEKGLTLIPLSVYIKRGIEIGVARGKHTFDKKAAIASRDLKRDTERELKYR